MLGGLKMDNFMDKIAQKLNAQDIIRANSTAEAMELKKMQLQIVQYEKIIQEMRKVTLKSMEAATQVQMLADASCTKIEALKTDIQANDQDFLLVVKKNEEEIAQLINNNNQEIAQLINNSNQEIAQLINKNNQQDEIARLMENDKKELDLLIENNKNEFASLTETIKGEFAQLNENVHKENVKVYRNVQAVVVDGFKEQELRLESVEQQIKGNMGPIKKIAILIVVVSLLNLGVLITNILGIL